MERMRRCEYGSVGVWEFGSLGVWEKEVCGYVSV
jgi:hypothetical protein